MNCPPEEAASSTQTRSCPSCSIDHFRAERLDAWTMAYEMLNGKDWGEDYGDPCPADVLNLAHYLDGSEND